MHFIISEPYIESEVNNYFYVRISTYNDSHKYQIVFDKLKNHLSSNNIDFEFENEPNYMVFIPIKSESDFKKIIKVLNVDYKLLKEFIDSFRMIDFDFYKEQYLMLSNALNIDFK